MTGDTPPAADTPAPPIDPPRAPGNRVSAGFVVAIVVAALMLFGIVGLVAAALLGDDDEPTGAGLGPQVDVDAPATAPASETTDDEVSAATVPDASSAGAGSDEDPAAVSSAEVSESTSGASASSGDNAEAPPSGDDDFSEDPTITTVAGVDDIEPPASDDLPEPADDPVVLPVQVTTPPPPSTFPAVPFDDVGPGSVAALDGWSEDDRSADHVAFTRDEEMVEVFVLGGVATADAALETFYDDVRLEELTRSPMTRLGAPSGRFLSVAGSEYVATTARQQGTTTMSGTIVAAVRLDGTAVVLTTSRSGESSEGELAADAEVLEAILAQL